MSSNIQITKNCLYCGKEFTAKTLVTRYCGHVCNRKHYKQLKKEEKLQAYNEAEAAASQPQAFDSTLQLKEFLSIEEVAMLLGASRRTIFRLLASNKLKAGKVGSRSIIKRSEIDKLFN